MMRFWFREDVALDVAQRYRDWHSLTDSDAFMQSPDEIQFETADIWISCARIGEPFDIPGAQGWKAVEILVNSNAPASSLRDLFEQFGGLYRGEV